MENIFTIPQLDTIQNQLTEINQKIDNLTKSKMLNDNENLTRHEAAKVLKICVTSLDNYRKQGLIKGFKIGRKRLYKLSEINQLDKSLKNE